MKLKRMLPDAIRAVVAASLVCLAGMDAQATVHNLGTFGGTRSISGKITASEKINNGGIYLGGTGTYINPYWTDLFSTSYAHVYVFTAAASGTMRISSFTTSHPKGDGSVSITAQATQTTEWYNPGTGEMPVTKGSVYNIQVYSARAYDQTFSFTLSAPGTGGTGGGGGGGGGGGTVVNTVTITFDANGGYFYDDVWTTSSLNKVTWSFTKGAYVLPGAPLCAKDGYVFAGWYTASGVQLTGTTVASSSVTYYAQWSRPAKPDLSPYTPQTPMRWSSPLVVASSKGAFASTTTTFRDADSLYVSWAVICSGADVNNAYTIALYVDGVRKFTWRRTTRHSVGSYTYAENYSIGSLAVGTHTIRLVADDNGEVDEASEANNSYTKTITVTRTPGSCEEASVWFTMPSKVTTYGVTLVREWCSSYYSSVYGVFFAQTSVSAGRLYTIALPKGTDFTVGCADAEISYGVDDSLRYCLIDTREMAASVALASLIVRGDVGARATVHVVAADYMPYGNTCKPEVLPASAASGQFRYDVTRASRGGKYVFSLDAVPGMRYEMQITGGGIHAIDIYGDHELIDSASGIDFRRVLFTCPKGGRVSIWAFADATGQMAVTWFGVAGSNRFRLSFDGNGGTVQTAWTRVAYGDRVGALPAPDRAGHVFDGWYTAREGGVRVTADTKMTVAADVMLYAHWTALVAGSCDDAAIEFVLTDSIATYNVNLVREWRADSASYGDGGVLCCAATVERGRLYTIAMPLDSGFDVDCEDDGAVVTYGEDDALAYYLIDTRKMFADSAKVHLRITGDVGERVTVYAVAGDYMPLGSWGKAEVLPADNGVADFSYKVVRNLRNGWYFFSLVPVPDMAYEFRVSGPDGIGIFAEGDEEDDEIIHVLDSSGEEGRNSAFIVFTCPSNKPLTLIVGADTTGPVTVEWSARRDESMMRLALDGNGGSVPVGWVPVERGKPVGSLPDAAREGFLFDGWYTEREGGVRMTETTVLGSVSDATVYARWNKLVLGSCAKASVPFLVPTGVVAYNVALTRYWDDEESAYVDDGVLFCTTTLRRGGLYTIAMPLDGPYFEVECEVDGVDVAYGEDDSLSYRLVDTRGMSAESAAARLVISAGDVGEKATVYAVAADYMPLGSSGKPEVLPATITSDDGYFYYDVRRSLRNGSYDFKLNAIPGVIYELSVGGRKGLSISLDGGSEGTLSILDSSNSRDSAYVLFSSPQGGEVSISVDADVTGPFTAEWSGTTACDDCYDTAP